jgi:tetratricopeptide (TPR) repeat protein
MTTTVDVHTDTPFSGTARYEVRGLLGRGANGVVYRALDSETGRDVALKTLTGSDAEQLYHLKAEFRALSMIAHPNLVQLDALVVSGSECFFTMELLEGRTFHDFARALRGNEWTEGSLDAFVAALRQLVAGITALHAAGKLHRDIKPTNVIVTHDGRAVLVDFGLCTELRLVERARSSFVGTLLYMAPEQAWGKPLSPAADWYALGAVLYEAIVGKAAFEGAPAALLFAKQAAPSLPHDLSPRTRSIAELAVALMAPDPARRPKADAILAALQSSETTAATKTAPPFIGRRAETASLEAAFADVQRGRPAVAKVEGISGIGKTTLVESFLDGLEERGAVVLRGRCHPQESVAYDGFDGVIDSLSEWLSDQEPDSIAELAPDDAGALTAVFPVLARVRWSAAKSESTDEPFELRRKAFRALRQLLARIGERHAVAIAVADVQWGSSDTASLLAEVFHAPSTPRALLVLTYRTEDEASSALLSTLRTRGELLDTVHHLQLGPLTEGESRDLATQVLGDSHGELDDVVRQAGGHPLFLRELALAVSAASNVGKTDLRSLVMSRIARLPEAEREVLAIAATAGRPLPRRVALAAAGQGEQGRPNVVHLARLRFVRETDVGGEPAIEPYHASIRDASLAALDDDARRSRHRALADVLLRAPEPDGDVVDHLVAAGDKSTAARFAAIAAEKAERALAFDRAIQLYRLALEHGATDRAKLHVRLASALANAGRSREAAEAFVAAADETGEVELERQAAEHFLRGGLLDEGISRLRRVLTAADVPYPATPTRAFANVVAFRTRLAVRGLGYRERREDEIPPADLARADACWSAGLGHAWVDTMRAASFQARYMLLALDSGERSRVARALATEASQLASLGGASRMRKGRTIMRQALEMAETEDAQTRAFALLMAGSVEFYASRYDAALSSCGRAEEILRGARSHSEWELMTSNTLSLAGLAYLGELRTLRVRQAELLADAKQRGNLLTRVCLASGPANVGWLVADAPDEAQRHTDEAIAPWSSDRFQLPHYLHLVASTQIALYRGDAEGAWERLRAEWPRLRSSLSLHVQNFRVTALHLRARAAIALARKSGTLGRARLLRSAKSDASKLAREDVAWAEPLSLSIEAQLAAAAGDRDVAADRLEHAARKYRDLAMLLHAAAADHERGRIISGERGRALLRTAEAWMVDQRVADPPRLTALLIAGE